MTQTAKAQEPSMEEILASIRRIIADDDAKPAKGPTGAPQPTPSAKQTAAPATPKPVANSQDDIDAMLAELDGPPKATPKPAASQSAAPDVFDLTEAMTSQ